MKDRNFGELLAGRMRAGKIVCVGLDPNPKRLEDRRESGQRMADVQLEFCKNIVDLTKDVALCYKPNIAFFLGVRGGLIALEKLIAYIKEVAPEVPIILDAKQGDIDSTNEGYIELDYSILKADAVTLHPYMGRIKGMQLFLDDPNKGAIVLCRTSNDGGAEFQNVPVTPLRHTETGELFADIKHFEIEYPGESSDNLELAEPMPMYEFVAARVAYNWNGNGNCYLVVGATAPIELERIRAIVGSNAFILIPGLKTQGGEAAPVVQAGYCPSDDGQHGMIINFSRSIIFADDPEAEALSSHDELVALLPQAA